MQIRGLNSLTKNLNRLARKHGSGGSVVVFYTAEYAIHVHEHNKHYNSGQWKYLETPARELAPEVPKIVASAVRGGATMEQGLLIAGMRIQRESQDKYAPVLTGALKASADTATAQNEETVAAKAKARSDAIRSKAAASKKK